jgi:hypothetical protein
VWKQNASSAWFHIHKKAFSAWSYGEHMEKNSAPPKQTHTNNAFAKSKMLLNPSCGTPKTATTTQREKVLNWG